MKKTWIAMTLLASMATGFAHAQQNCDKPRNDFDGLYCLNKVYAQTDADLNTAYGDLAGRLDAGGKRALKSAQLAWMRDRNERCSRSEGDQFFVNLGCATRVTRERLQVLQERVRECKSSGCQPSKL